MKYLAVLLLIPAAWPQSPAARPVFEAASIKMTAPAGGGGNSNSRGTPGLLREAVAQWQPDLVVATIDGKQITAR